MLDIAGFSLCVVAQAGRLEAEALILAASLCRAGWGARLHVAEPRRGPLWPAEPGLSPEGRAYLLDCGAQILPLDARVFGAAYPQGNKIEALSLMPEGRPFLFLDTDTLIVGRPGPMPPAPPAASLRRTNSWPRRRPGGPGRAAIWRALYRRFGLDPRTAQDRRFPAGDWRRWPYYNAGWILGPCPRRFAQLYLHIARTIRDDPPPELAGQKLHPWLDQIALPLVIHALGGSPAQVPDAGLDGAATRHYRALPLLYATESDQVLALFEEIVAEPRLRALLARHEPFRRMVMEGEGARARAMFDRGALPPEAEIRRRLKAAGLFLR
ncbi:MAG: hypothetical protein KatS3mg118_2121 [Paracoccaceae bacterium]|nr:MAG: hypothetical protein KatS3mg118_2121 [Paracoccaceae bacterium]